LLKRASAGWGHAGGETLNELGTSDDGYIRLVYEGADHKDTEFGFVETGTTRDYNLTKVIYGFQISYLNEATIVHNQAKRTKVSVVSGDILKTEFIGDQVYYLLNGMIIEQHSISRKAYVVNVAIYTNNSCFGDFFLSFFPHEAFNNEVYYTESRNALLHPNRDKWTTLTSPDTVRVFTKNQVLSTNEYIRYTAPRTFRRLFVGITDVSDVDSLQEDSFIAGYRKSNSTYSLIFEGLQISFVSGRSTEVFELQFKNDSIYWIVDGIELARRHKPFADIAQAHLAMINTQQTVFTWSEFQSFSDMETSLSFSSGAQDISLQSITVENPKGRISVQKSDSNHAVLWNGNTYLTAGELHTLNDSLVTDLTVQLDSTTSYTDTLSYAQYDALVKQDTVRSSSSGQLHSLVLVDAHRDTLVERAYRVPVEGVLLDSNLAKFNYNTNGDISLDSAGAWEWVYLENSYTLDTTDTVLPSVATEFIALEETYWTIGLEIDSDSADLNSYLPQYGFEVSNLAVWIIHNGVRQGEFERTNPMTEVKVEFDPAGFINYFYNDHLWLSQSITVPAEPISAVIKVGVRQGSLRKPLLYGFDAGPRLLYQRTAPYCGLQSTNMLADLDVFSPGIYDRPLADMPPCSLQTCPQYGTYVWRDDQNNIVSTSASLQTNTIGIYSMEYTSYSSGGTPVSVFAPQTYFLGYDVEWDQYTGLTRTPTLNSVTLANWTLGQVNPPGFGTQYTSFGIGSAINRIGSLTDYWVVGNTELIDPNYYQQNGITTTRSALLGFRGESSTGQTRMTFARVHNYYGFPMLTLRSSTGARSNHTLSANELTVAVIKSSSTTQALVNNVPYTLTDNNTLLSGEIYARLRAEYTNISGDPEVPQLIGWENCVTSLPCSSPSYNRLFTRLDGDFYNTIAKNLYFLYDAQYTNDSLDYQVVRDDNQLDVTGQVSLDKLTRTYGDNRYKTRCYLPGRWLLSPAHPQ